MIILSAGHHPKATGATWGSLIEFEEATKWIRFIQAYLVAELGRADVKTINTGTLTSKVSQVNSICSPNDLAVELHFNSAGLNFISGCETLYCPGSIKGKALANEYHNSYIQSMGVDMNKDRGVRGGWLEGDVPLRVDFTGDVEGDESVLYFLKSTNCPALILEPYFMCELEALPDWTHSAKTIALALSKLQ